MKLEIAKQKGDLGSTLPLSSAIQTESLVFVSGQGGLDPQTGAIVGPDLHAQTVRTLDNMKLILADANLTMDDIVKCTVYLSDRKLYQEFNSIYGGYFTAPYPSRTVVYCDLNYDLLVEIDAIAVRRG